MTVAAPSAIPRSPRRNWGGVVIATTGAALVLATVLNGISRSIVDFPTFLFGPIFGIQLGLYLLAPLALLTGFAPVTFGGSGLIGIAGPNTRARLWLFGSALIALAAQYTVAGLFIAEIGEYDDGVIARTTNTALVISVFGLLVALAAGIVVARAKIVTGVARWSLIVTVGLVAVTIAGYFVSFESNWTELPYAVGILFLGLSWWRAGLPGQPAVPDTSKSLAE